MKRSLPMRLLLAGTILFFLLLIGLPFYAIGFWMTMGDIAAGIEAGGTPMP